MEQKDINVKVGDIVITDTGRIGIVKNVEHQPELEYPFWFEVESNGVIYYTHTVKKVKKNKKNLASLLNITLNS